MLEISPGFNSPAAPQSLTVTHSPPAIPRHPQQSPTVLSSPLWLSEALSSPTQICLTLPGLPSSIMTAVLRFLRQEWTAFRHPVPSGVLSSHLFGPYRGSELVRTLI